MDCTEQILCGEHTDPHSYLGWHDGVIRLYRPGAREIFFEVEGEIVSASLVHPSGIFEHVAPEPKEYRIYHCNGLLARDPYSFPLTWGALDCYLFAEGTHYELYRVMGAHYGTFEGIEGVRFAVWAPNALRVSLIGDFNFWDGRINPMRKIEGCGVWEIFVPGITPGERYRYEIKTESREVQIKADPYGFRSEVRPMTASIVADIQYHKWKDQHWLYKREKEAGQPKPMNIYEVHLGSWKKPHDHFLNYRELAMQLASYCKEMRYTHIELMPIEEHPLDESWGYQLSGFFAVTSRFGQVEDFQFFVDHMHQMGIGVILDWVPAHFPADHFSLANFDGTCLYEHRDRRKGFQPQWNTLTFNYGRIEVSNFLIASALFWIDMMHVDGLRVD
ncbi:MAG: GlgB N-terminal domain-containing protein, partial [Chlamydiales bacterium]